MTDIAKIAAGLSDYEQGWLQGSLVPACKADEVAAHNLERLHLLDGAWDITPLGLAVRKYLEQQND